FTDTNHGVAVGGSLDTGEGIILQTTDGGNSWVPKTPPGTFILTAISFAGANNGTAVGFGDIVLRTTDGGSSWNQEHSGVAEGLWGVSVPDPSTVTAVGTFGAIVKRAVAPRITPPPRPRPSPHPR
ncbi:MAG TPA: YCF48-related protein, partial [Candidatus Udaeobacter sp.]|nr:YCF48-related protein [Candidatus Udaeobacter sp.]